MRERLERFVELSAALTGFGHLELLGTALANDYLTTLDAILPPGFMNELILAYERLPGGPECEPALASGILDDARFGPVARNVILLWYCGTWTVLPDAWRAVFGASPLDSTRVISGQAYQ